jgi:ParB-like chromosome segregation protein Spo0J|tara:strand:- start:896 stop:1369 length:474 start_codon:yes stop_codon:yes gene_type:complete
MEHKIIHREIGSLIFAEYNPRQLTKDQYQNLKDSISRFGLVDPIIVNSNKDRKNIIVGGHQRVKVAKDMDIEYVPVLEVDLTYEKERELNIRLNKNTGEWDMDILANNFEIEELIGFGFDEEELKLFNEDYWKEPNQKEYDENIETDNKCPKCEYEW